MKKPVMLILAAALFLAAPAGPSAAGEPDGDLRLASILKRSNRSYESLRNYQAIFYKKERAGGRLGETEKIFLKFEKPFKIFMNWLNTEKKDLQVVYERGKHNGKLAIHQPELGFGFFPVVFLDQNSPWVKKGSESYRIEDAGIGAFLADFTQAVARARDERKLQVRPAKNNSGDPDETLEVIFDDPGKNPVYFAHRVIVTFDKITALPVKIQLFDWENEPTGIYSYENLKLNLTPEDVQFKQRINRQLYRVYQGE